VILQDLSEDCSCEKSLQAQSTSCCYRECSTCLWHKNDLGRKVA
jgi:hypothetical protein